MKNIKRTLFLTGMLVAALTLAACGGGDDPTPTPAPAAVEQLPSQELATATPAAAGETASTSTESTTTESTTTESTTTETTTESTTAPSGGPVASSGNAAIDAVASALRNQIANLPMRLTMSSAGEEVGTIEIASPTRIRTNMGGMEMMFVDGKAYLNMDGAWTENPEMAGMVEMMAGQFAPDAIQSQVDTIATAEQLPDETVNGEAVSVYRFTANDEVVPGNQSGTKVYIRKSDNLPVRLSDDGTGEETFLADYVYDSSIVIEAPQ